jgi:plasmid stabilization system protein ParE
MAIVIWSPRAIQDLDDICEYIARGSERYARVFAKQVVRLIESIALQPRQGWVVPEYDRDDLRERLLHNYRIVYRLRDEVIEIVTITHGARLLPPPPRQ